MPILISNYTAVDYCDVIDTWAIVTLQEPIIPPWLLWTLSYHVILWRWGQWVEEIVEYTSVVPSFSSVIIDRICGTINKDHLARPAQHVNYSTDWFFWLVESRNQVSKFAYRGRITHYDTVEDRAICTFLFIVGPSCFNTGDRQYIFTNRNNM